MFLNKRIYEYKEQLGDQGLSGCIFFTCSLIAEATRLVKRLKMIKENVFIFLELSCCIALSWKNRQSTRQCKELNTFREAYNKPLQIRSGYFRRLKHV